MGAANDGGLDAAAGQPGYGGSAGAGGSKTDASPIEASADAAHPANTIILDPPTIQFFNLPISSLRFGISGYDPVVHACATLIWDYSNNGAHEGAHCDDFHETFPYAVVKMGTDGPCGDWDYGGNVAYDEGKGCVDFKQLGMVDMDLVDVELKVHGAPFTGTILASNLSLLDPQPTVFILHYLSDVPENVFVQTSDSLGLPSWVRVRRKGQAVQLFDRCDVPSCASPGPICGPALHQVLDITSGSAVGQVAVVWDGKLRMTDPDKNCQFTDPAPDGAYDAEFCFGWDVTEGPEGKDVKAYCDPQPFERPAVRVVHDVNNGG